MRFQSIYNSVTVTRENPETGRREEMEIAVNIEGEGLFVRDGRGDWKQWRGTGQFRARSAVELVQRFRRDQDDDTVRMVRGSAVGWKLDPASAAARALASIRTPKRAEASRANGRKPVRDGSRPRGRPRKPNE